jgi:hypothetical protein
MAPDPGVHMKRTLRECAVAAAAIALLTGCGGKSEDYTVSYGEGYRQGSDLSGTAWITKSDGSSGCDAIFRMSNLLSGLTLTEDSKNGFLDGCRDGVDSLGLSSYVPPAPAAPDPRYTPPAALPGPADAGGYPEPDESVAPVPKRLQETYAVACEMCGSETSGLTVAIDSFTVDSADDLVSMALTLTNGRKAGPEAVFDGEALAVTANVGGGTRVALSDMGWCIDRGEHELTIDQFSAPGSDEPRDSVISPEEIDSLTFSIEGSTTLDKC